MTQISYKSISRCFGILLILALSFNCSKDEKTPNAPQPEQTSNLTPDGSNVDAPTVVLSQTKTANLFNNWGEAVLNLWFQGGPQYFLADDDSYAYSKKLSRNRWFLALLLQDFRFEIPSNATIENIVVTARRFKKGPGSINDYFASLVRRFNFYDKSEYGIWFTNPNSYPNTETEVVYHQNGTGNNGGFTLDQFYQWTPAIINDPAFGVRIDSYEPVGSVRVYYDRVQITVEYSLP